MSPRLVFLSDHKAHGQLVANALAERGIALSAVIVCVDPGKSRFSFWAWNVAAKMRRHFNFYRRHKPFYAFLKTRVLQGEGMNSESMRKTLLRLEPDYIIVGSGPILKPHIIETARCGVLNVHPALLPWVRGSGVVGHSLAQRVPVGATVHFIDAGIDTGALIERRLLPMTSAPTTLPALEAAAGHLAAHLMADVVATIAHSGKHPPALPQTARFPLFKWPNPQGRARLNSLATSGRALELFESWKIVSEGAPHWRLPFDLMEAPLLLGPEEGEKR